jgi:hypothetical protein
MAPRVSEGTNDLKLEGSTAYFLKKTMSRNADVQEQPLATADDLVAVNFEIDGSVSNVQNEHLKFA